MDTWFRERQERAERTLRERGPSLGALLDAFRQVTDDPISEGAARIVGQAIGIFVSWGRGLLRMAVYVVYAPARAGTRSIAAVTARHHDR